MKLFVAEISFIEEEVLKHCAVNDWSNIIVSLNANKFVLPKFR